MKGTVAERAADQLVAAQRIEAGTVWVRVETIGEIRRPRSSSLVQEANETSPVASHLRAARR